MEEKEIRFLTKEEIEKIEQKNGENEKRLEERARKDPKNDKFAMKQRDKILRQLRKRF